MCSYTQANKNTVSILPTVMLSQPCFCLCFGFSQMTMTLPLRRMILHFSQIGFTDGRTFMCCYLLLKMMPRGRAECTARPDASDAMCLSHSASVIIHQRPPSVKRKILRNRGFRHGFLLFSRWSGLAAPSNPAAVEIIGRQLDFYLVTGVDADEVHAHFAGDDGVTM